MSKIGFKITPDNIDYLIGGVKVSYDDTDKKRILKNLFFEKGAVSKQTEEKLKKVWW